MSHRTAPKPVRSFAISVANEQSRHAVDEQALVAAARNVLNDSRFDSANIGLAIVDDTTIHELNRRHLSHDWPTDVLSFVLDESHSHLEGEVIISADTAAAAAADAGWAASAEQLLYVIHGMLHLVGYRDKSPEDRAQMRAAEAAHLRKLGLELPPELDETFRALNRGSGAEPMPKGAKAR
jgi:probable rRNA maturation factor